MSGRRQVLELFFSKMLKPVTGKYTVIEFVLKENENSMALSSSALKLKILWWTGKRISYFVMAFLKYVIKYLTFLRMSCCKFNNLCVYIVKDALFQIVHLPDVFIRCNRESTWAKLCPCAVFLSSKRKMQNLSIYFGCALHREFLYVWT